MFTLTVVLTVLLLCEVVPSAVVALFRARVGLVRLDELTRLGVLQGQFLWVVSLLGVLHLFATVAVIVGLWVPALGVAGAAVEAVIFGWVLSRQLRAGDRGRSLGAYLLFLAMALAVLVVNLLR
ncbi:hypothetical protein [Streptomyces sp. RKAG293]|uniref:hypothetical protein n=1 Tax=Streptomyces sp. RKAG293 TaxID=2893403 RepID=UPI002034398F|nr:hypothetical protein [Streptomyces sp. RKAG293]MCM2422513.1 hypothetical protein [Streptomyces sp. RKAG293]